MLQTQEALEVATVLVMAVHETPAAAVAACERYARHWEHRGNIGRMRAGEFRQVAEYIRRTRQPAGA